MPLVDAPLVRHIPTVAASTPNIAQTIAMDYSDESVPGRTYPDLLLGVGTL